MFFFGSHKDTERITVNLNRISFIYASFLSVYRLDCTDLPG
jgi:hypothetical protein